MDSPDPDSPVLPGMVDGVPGIPDGDPGIPDGVPGIPDGDPGILDDEPGVPGMDELLPPGDGMGLLRVEPGDPLPGEGVGMPALGEPLSEPERCGELVKHPASISPSRAALAILKPVKLFIGPPKMPGF